MKNWIEFPLQLTGKAVSVISLNRKHLDALIALASDKRIWEHYAVDGSDKATLTESLEAAITERERGIQYPFVITEETSNKVIGSTRFLDIQPVHKKLEIGWTWFHPDYWGTCANLETKLLLLTYCFENLETRRVQLRTDENNLRSRKAIEKIGAKPEGIIRNDMIRQNCTSRNSVYYGLTDDDWETTKANLQVLIDAKEKSIR